MSLAATTATTLAIVEGALLKRLTTPYEPQRFQACVVSKAHTWSPDNQTLYVISSDTIHAFSPNTGEVKLLFNPPQRLPLQPVVIARDNSTIIFAQGSSIHVLGLGSNVPKITNTLIGHSSSIASLSLSNDASLLASSSISGTLCVHNLSHNSLTVLKSPPTSASSGRNIICRFHPHTRTRLLVGSGRTLTVYDTSRPSAPIKTIQLTEKENTGFAANPGQIVAISCSPFSKALAAVAFNSGMIALIDLDKDRALLKTIHIQVPVTSMTFTADGASLALGTESGKIILKEWRSSEDDTRIICVDSENRGERITALSIQHRLKHSPTTTSGLKTLSTAKPSTTAAAPLAPYDLNHANGKSLGRRVTSSSRGSKEHAAATPSRNRKAVDKPQRAFSPPKAPVPVTDDESGDVSVQMDALMGDTGRVKKPPKSSSENIPLPKSRYSTSSCTSSLAPDTASTTDRSGSSAALHDLPSSKSTTRARAVSLKSTTFKVASPSTKKTIISSTTQLSFNDVKGRTLSFKAARPTASKSPSVNRAVNSLSGRRASAVLTENSSRTPTPELHSIEVEAPIWQPTIPINVDLPTPDVDRWLEAGRGPTSAEAAGDKAKHVGWAISSNSDIQGGFSDNENDEDERTIPARPLPLSVAASTMTPIRRPNILPDSNSIQTSPPQSLQGEDRGPTGSVTQPQDLIRALVNDMIHDYQREMREDIQGLHLDLLRMGRNWKHELRSLMEEYIGDLKDMREENTRLRRENDRLRRGF
ncbi:WD40-repeat-containing domain protein [Hysterangium stoloniferum]|nr:WD40-repeat-containing domain protein [Hysterangium stoloniferum]